MPVWMSHGVRGDFTDYRGKALVERRPNWRFTVFPTGAMPYFEQPAAFIAAYDAFLSGLAAG
ncbi:MAG: alpha/beta hydrolase, partial [Roseateles sp.]